MRLTQGTFSYLPELTDQQIKDALAQEQETGQTLDQILVAKSMLSEQKCLDFFAEFLGLEARRSLDGTAVPGAFIQNVPVQFARTHNLVALEQKDRIVKVATCQPLNVQPMDDLATMMGKEVEAVLATPAE